MQLGQHAHAHTASAALLSAAGLSGCVWCSLIAGLASCSFAVLSSRGFMVGTGLLLNVMKGVAAACLCSNNWRRSSLQPLPLCSVGSICCGVLNMCKEGLKWHMQRAKTMQLWFFLLGCADLRFAQALVYLGKHISFCVALTCMCCICMRQSWHVAA
jgi:hypothetical protein